MTDLWYHADGVRLYAVQEGRSHTVIMLHGGGGDHRASWPFVASLAHRYRVIAPDLRGSGKSHCAAPLSWDRFAGDVRALMDHLGVPRAVVGGASMGTGAALGFAARFHERVAGLVVIWPVYAGEESGLTQHQAATFGSLHPLIAKARIAGVEAFRPLYRQSPEMEAYFDSILGSLDPESFLATNEFMASGAQPFVAAADLRAIDVPTLLVPGNDPMHPAEISELYATKIPHCTTLKMRDTPDFDRRHIEIAAAIGDFCDRRARW
jgi:3-oxoadipate enol-lactonase